jgi:AbrB family looped-hinge helix DNA binding protein
MKYTTFTTEIKEGNIIEIPPEVRDKFDMRPGDKLEITFKKIKSRRLEILVSENPLYKLMRFSD